MERVISLDDIVGGMWKFGPGFGRTDSEAAFQDFLKRIPSASNLASQEQLQQQVQMQQHAFQQQQMAAQQEMLQGLQNVQGMPRVPSLDILRQLLVNPSLSPALPKPVLPASIPEHVPQPTAVPVVSLSQPEPVLATSSQPHPLLPGAVPLNLSTPPIQLGQFNGVQVKCSEQAQDSYARAELRRARRMLSNRESARRSRRRKQEHLHTLEGQIDELEKEREELLDKVEELGKRLDTSTENLQKFQNDNQELRKELEKLRSQVGQAASKKPKREFEDAQEASASKRHRSTEVISGTASSTHNAPSQADQKASVRDMQHTAQDSSFSMHTAFTELPFTVSAV